MSRKIESKREKRLTEEITFASLSLALGIIFLSLSYVIPGITLFLMILIPFTSCFFALNSDYKGQLIYIASIIAVSFIDFQGGFFDLLPNALIGLFYGNALKYFKADFITYFIALIGTFLIELALLIPVNLIFKVNMVKIYSTIFNIDLKIFEEIFLLFMFLLSLIQTLITFICITNELPKLNIKHRSKKSNTKVEFLVLVTSFSVFLALTTIYLKPLSYVIICLLILILTNYILEFMFTYGKKIKISYIVSFVIDIIVLVISLVLSDKNLVQLSFVFMYIPSYLLSLFVIIYKCDKSVISSKEESKDILDLLKGKNDGSIS